VNAESIASAALSSLARAGQFDVVQAAKALRELGISPDAPDPAQV
jgi:hypothetical protein